MDHKRVTLLALLLTIFASFGQSYYVHRPDARVVNHAFYNINLHLAPGGGLLAGLKVGFFDRFQIGLSYGGDTIIGSGPIEWYPIPPNPGVQAKVAVFDEFQFPLSLALGFDSQDPKGSVNINQAGFYLVTGKEIPAGWVAFDLALGAGYDIIDEQAFHLYMVSGLILGDAFSLTPELTVHPQKEEDILNLGVSFMWEIYEGTGAEFLLADLLADPAEGWTRSVRLQVTQEF